LLKGFVALQLLWFSGFVFKLLSYKRKVCSISYLDFPR